MRVLKMAVRGGQDTWMTDPSPLATALICRESGGMHRKRCI